MLGLQIGLETEMFQIFFKRQGKGEEGGIQASPSGVESGKCHTWLDKTGAPPRPVLNVSVVPKAVREYG